MLNVHDEPSLQKESTLISPNTTPDGDEASPQKKAPLVKLHGTPERNESSRAAINAVPSRVRRGARREIRPTWHPHRAHEGFAFEQKRLLSGRLQVSRGERAHVLFARAKLGVDVRHAINHGAAVRNGRN